MLDFLYKDHTFEDYQSEIDNLKKNESILHNSYKFLNEKIQDFRENGKLEKHEIDFIKEQIEFHKKLALLKKDFLKSKTKLTTRSRKNIEKDCGKFEKIALSIPELKYLKGKIESEEFKLQDSLPGGDDSYRDIVERNIDIKYWYESIYLKDIFNTFYNDFTKEYLNVLEKKYSDKEIFKIHQNPKKGLFGTKNSFYNIIKTILIDKYELYKDFNSKLEINIGGKKEVFYIKDIKTEIEESHEVPIKDKKEKKDIKILNPNKDLIKKRKHMNDILGVELDSNILLSEHLNKNGLLKENGESTETLKILNILISKYFYGQKILVNGKTKTITKEIIEDNKEEIIKNFIIFINFLLAIESYGGENVSNRNNSGAEGYFQFKNNNYKTGYEIMIKGKYIETSKKTWKKFNKKVKKMIQGKDINNIDFKGIVTKYNERYKPSSLEMAIKRTKRFYGKNAPLWLKNIKTNIDGKISNKDFDIKDYGYEEQMILWLIDLFEREAYVGGKKIRQYIANILFGSQYDARELYTKVHHSQISSAEPLVQNQVKGILSKLKIIL